MQILRTLFQNLDSSEFIAMRAIVQDSKDVVAEYVNTIEEAETFAMKHRTSRNVYFGVCTRNAKRPEEIYAARAFAAWADVDGAGSDKKGLIDIPKEEALAAALETLILPPSIVIDSGHGYHLYWLLHEPTSDLTKVKTANTKIQKALSSGAVADAARILRVDGTFNHKTTPPVLVQLHSHNTHKYNIQDISAMCRLDPKVVAKIRKGDSRGHKSKSERDWAVLLAMVKAGFSDEGIRFVFANESFGIGDKYRAKPPEGGEKYFERTLKKVRSETNVSPEDGEAVSEVDTDATIAIIEKDDCYFMVTESGLKQLSTFVFEPLILLHGETSQDPDTIVGNVKASGYTWNTITMPRKAFVDGRSLIKELPLAAWQWIGPDIAVRHLLPYLMDRLRAKGLPKRTATNELGYYKGGFWIGSTQTITSEGLVLEDEATVVAMPTKGERPRTTYSTEKPDQILIREFFDLVQKINEPGVVWPILTWTAVCPYKSRLQEFSVRFPVLNLYGTRGSGKTSIITRVVQPLMGYDEPRTYDCSTTKFVQLSLLGGSNGVPVAFSEYRSTMRTSAERMLRYLLLSYDVGHDPRGRPDQTVQDYSLAAPFSVDGNDALSDEAVLERVIQVNMHPETIDETSEAFETFQDITTLNLKKVGTAYIISTLKQDPKELWEKAFALCRKAFPQKMPDRVRRNISCCVLGALSLYRFAEEYGCADALPEMNAEFVTSAYSDCLGNIINITTGRGNIVTDKFIEDLINEFALQNGFTQYFISRYDDVENIFWFQLSTALTWWRIKSRQQDLAMMDSAAIKAQLRERMAQTLEDFDLGQYIVAREAKTVDGRTYWMYGVALKAANVSGLDVPQSLAPLKIKIVSKEKEESKNERGKSEHSSRQSSASYS